MVASLRNPPFRGALWDLSQSVDCKQFSPSPSSHQACASGLAEHAFQLCNASLEVYKTEGMEEKTGHTQGSFSKFILEKDIKLELVSYSNWFAHLY